MIVLASVDDKEKIDSYISDDYSKCLYLYLNYKRYGFNTKHVNVYLQYNDLDVCSLILKYYNTIHVYSKKKEIDYNELTDFLLKNNPTMICAEKIIIENLEKRILKNDYLVEYGSIRCLSNIDNVDKIDLVEAKEKDFGKITKLLMSDEGLSGSQTYDNLKNQLLERYKQKFSRNFILKDNDKIIAHVCTGAENEEIAILTNLIVDNNYRNKGLGKKVCENFCSKLIEKNQKVFLVNYTKESTKLYEKIGFIKCCDWGKLYKKVK